MRIKDGLGRELTDEEVEQLEDDADYEHIMGFDMGLDGAGADALREWHDGVIKHTKGTNR